jgi:RloB-like protein
MARPERERKRNEHSLRRRPISQVSGDIILIVCEGGKTEPDYFRALTRNWRLHSAQVEVVGEECGSAPISVVDHALALRKRRLHEVKRGRASLKFDQVWCVFDFDRHESLQRAIKKARDNRLSVALSVPRFEFWYLLHFVYSTRPFSSCDKVVRELKKHVAGYDKKSPPFDCLLQALDTALENAEKVRKHVQTSAARGPSTDVDKLVAELKSLAR